MPYKVTLTIWTNKNPQWTDLHHLADEIHTGKLLTEQYKLDYTDLQSCPGNVQRWFKARDTEKCSYMNKTSIT